MMDGVEYYYEIVGSGPPLLLLHGFTGDYRTWLPFVKYWKESYQLIMIDILGHGKSDSPSDQNRYDIKSVAADLAFFLEQLNIEKAHVLGYSMGGRLALTFSILYPEKVASLILESSSPGLQLAEEKKARIQQDEKLANMILDQGLEEFVHYWEDIPLFSSQKLLEAKVQEQIRIHRLEQNPIGLANSLKGMGTGKQPSWWPELSDIKKPLLLLCGELDTKFCQLNGNMKDYAPHAQLHMFLEAGHAIHVEKPDYFGTIVKKFIDNVERGVNQNVDCLDK